MNSSHEGRAVVPAAANLPLVGGESSKCSDLCGPGLWRLLSEGEDRDGAIRLITINQTLRARLADVAPGLAERAAPIDPEELMVRLVKLWMALRLPERTTQEWEATTEVYVDTLGQIPAEAIDTAILRWNQAEMYPDQPGRHAFFPTPAELFHLARPRHLLIAKAAYRAQLAMKRVTQAPPKALAAPDRSGRREQLIREGVLTPDGKLALQLKGFSPQAGRRESPHALAERLRAAAAGGDEEEAV